MSLVADRIPQLEPSQQALAASLAASFRHELAARALAASKRAAIIGPTDWGDALPPPSVFLTHPDGLNLGGAPFPYVLDILDRFFTGSYEEAAIRWGLGSGKGFLASGLLCFCGPRRRSGTGLSTTGHSW
jgi:hypothetical protein